MSDCILFLHEFIIFSLPLTIYHVKIVKKKKNFFFWVKLKRRSYESTYDLKFAGDKYNGSLSKGESHFVNGVIGV